MEITKTTKKLYNGVEIPVLGLGTWQIKNEIAADVVLHALQAGYRHIDTAAAYENEQGVGEGIRKSGIPRSEIFITSKIPAEYKSYEIAKRTIDESLAYLKTDYIDLMLIHAPRPWDEMYPKGKKLYEEENASVWRALEEGYKEGKFRAIGVSNFEPYDLNNIFAHCTVLPMVNQIRSFIGAIDWETLALCKEKNIAVEAYSPLATGTILNSEHIKAIALKYGVTAARLCIKYVLQLGLVALPKTTSPDRMKENTLVDFTISEEDMKTLNAMRF